MKTLAGSFEDFKQRIAPNSGPWFVCEANVAFYTGAAVMAEQFAAAHGAVALVVKELSVALVNETQRLHQRLQELEEKAGEEKADPAA